MSKIIVHCSASEFGTALMIDQWHKERGWKGIGYHAVIMNGYPDKSYLAPQRGGRDFRVKLYNGVAVPGRALDSDEFIEPVEVGAHAYGFNRDTVAVCLIGNSVFTKQQLIGLVKQIKLWQFQYNIKTDDVLGHCELPGVAKTCPNLDMETIRKMVHNKTESIRLFKDLGSSMKEVY